MSTDNRYLPTAINLPCGIVARIELVPMPKPSPAGTYTFNPPNTDIQIHLFRDEKLIEQRRWDTLIGGIDEATLADGSMLDADDLDELDNAGWQEMAKFGMVPTVWVEPIPRR
ncbi:hypothetical protein [Burkholderia anthina]|uniref:hypothetical protein n=1 Tax=Burkholderia anthina TaxID=179879 RepID=UPI0037C0878B